MLPPCTIILFGGTGDLTRKKLIPALYRLHVKSELDRDTRIITIGRQDLTKKKILAEYKKDIPKDIYKKSSWNGFSRRVQYHRLEFSDDDAYNSLASRVQKLPKKARDKRIFYLATPQTSFGTIVEHLNRAHLADRHPRKGWHRVVIEKPFGSDLKSARELNKEVTRLFSEDQIYRIDHYIGKNFVQEILAIRFANPLFENQWNARHIESIQIGISEDMSVGTRGGYYDRAGAIRDMLQNHLMQLLTLTAMEPPKTKDQIRDEKSKVLRNVIRKGPVALKKDLVVGQYTKGKNIRDYTKEKHVSPTSTTETYVALQLQLRNSRWKGVPFYLWTGKALNSRYAEISIRFKPGSWFKFNNRELKDNIMSIRIQPEEGLRFRINLFQGDDSVEPVLLDFTRPAQAGINSTEAYELLIGEIMEGNQTLFTRWDFVEESWRITDAIRRAKVPLHKYKAGTKGPFAALRLMRHKPHK